MHCGVDPQFDGDYAVSVSTWHHLALQSSYSETVLNSAVFIFGLTREQMGCRAFQTVTLVPLCSSN